MNHMLHQSNATINAKKYFLVFNPIDKNFERVEFKEIRHDDSHDLSTSIEN